VARLAALLFDLDGTLVDTDPLHLAAFNQELAPYGRSIDLPWYQTRIMGFSNAEIMPRLLPDAGPAEWEALADKKEAAFRARLGRLEPTPGLADLLAWAAAQALPCALVTNAPRANATAMLAGLGVADRFAPIVIGAELPHGKPHPLPYETALDALGIAATQAAAFEDSLSGVRSATAAGIATVGLTTGLDAAELQGAGAIRCVRDFTDAGLLGWLRERAS